MALGILQLTMITYFLVAAGPYGVEEIVNSVGPLMAILGTVFIPLILSLPLSFIFSEMGSLYPQPGSTIMWAHAIVLKLPQDKKLFKFITRLYANSLFLKSTFVNALVPVLISDYISSFWDSAKNILFKLVISFIVFLIALILNFNGLEAVGWSQWIFVFVTICPIIIFVLLCFPKYNTNSILISNMPKDPDFGMLFSNMIWQCIGFDQITNLSGDVSNPQKTYPISLSLTVLLLIFTFTLPIMSGSMILSDYTKWSSGTFATISLSLPGCSSGWLYWWLISAAIISLISVLNNQIACCSREIQFNSQSGYLPLGSWVGKDTVKKDKLIPMNAALVSSFFSIVMLFFSFNQLLKFFSFSIGFNLLIQLCIYIYTRHGKYGEQNLYGFQLKRTITVSIFITIVPYISIVAIFALMGWKPLVAWCIGQTLLLICYGIQLLVEKIKIKIDERKQDNLVELIHENQKSQESEKQNNNQISNADIIQIAQENSDLV